MKKKLQLLTRALVVIARDMFIGFIIGVSATVLMAGINPQTRNVVALFIPAGIAAGLFKGLAKFIFLNIFSSLPSKGYRHDYPKFKMALLWVALMLLVLVYSYGLNPLSWFREPLLLLQRNIILRDIGQSYWVAISVLVSALGIAAHFYEPPIEESEVLAAEEIEEDEVLAVEETAEDEALLAVGTEEDKALPADEREENGEQPAESNKDLL